MTDSDIDLIKTHFDTISSIQESQLIQLIPLYRYWNDRINIVSRKDIENLFTRHILHSLSVLKVVKFKSNSNVLDVGTGGGFPGIPLAIMNPNVKFTLIDSIAKKIRVVNEISSALKLQNVKGIQIKSTVHKGSYNYITGRAVTSFPAFYNSVKHLLNRKSKEGGIVYIKGGDFEDEIKKFKHLEVFNISDFFDDPFYETKKIIYLPV